MIKFLKEKNKQQHRIKYNFWVPIVLRMVLVLRFSAG